MLSNASNAIIPEQAVSYKFKMRDFADLFDGLNPEQIHVSLEAALNVVFAKNHPVNDVPVKDASQIQSEEENQLDHETKVVINALFAMYHHRTIDDEASVDDPDAIDTSDTIEDTPEYQQLEEMLQAIIDRFSAEIIEDKYNTDVEVLRSEMDYFDHIELFTYRYDPKNEILNVTINTTVADKAA
jgi:hypothetical protein